MKYVKQFSIILGISFLAELLEILIPLPIAASVYGLVIMLVGLITKLIPLEKVETAADFLVDAMSHYVRARYRGNHGKCELL